MHSTHKLSEVHNMCIVLQLAARPAAKWAINKTSVCDWLTSRLVDLGPCLSLSLLLLLYFSPSLSVSLSSLLLDTSLCIYLYFICHINIKLTNFTILLYCFLDRYSLGARIVSNNVEYLEWQLTLDEYSTFAYFSSSNNTEYLGPL